MKRLIQRYLSQLVREATKDEMVTPENLEQMKIDIVKEMQRIQNPEKHDKKLISLTSMAVTSLLLLTDIPQSSLCMLWAGSSIQN